MDTCDLPSAQPRRLVSMSNEDNPFDDNPVTEVEPVELQDLQFSLRELMFGCMLVIAVRHPFAICIRKYDITVFSLVMLLILVAALLL